MPKLTVIGCGWFGLPLARRMLERGWAVHGSARTDDRVAALAREGVRGFVFDMAQSKLSPESFAEAAVVVAVPAGRRAGNTEPFLRGVSRLLGHAVASRSRAVAVISSTAVYEGARGEVDEDTPVTDEENPLVQLERDLERAEVPTCAVRFGGLIGPDRHPGRFLAGRANVKGGDRPVNLVQGSDCVRALELLLDTPAERWPARMNVVSPEHPRRSEFYRAAALERGFAPPTFLTKEGQSTGREVRAAWLKQRGFAFSPLLDTRGRASRRAHGGPSPLRWRGHAPPGSTRTTAVP